MGKMKATHSVTVTLTVQLDEVEMRALEARTVNLQSLGSRLLEVVRERHGPGGADGPPCDLA